MKNRIVSISLALVLILSVGLIGCGGEETPEPIEYNLTVSNTGGGSITAPGEGTFTYEEGEVVNLIAEPDEGCRFVNWTGDVDDIADVEDAMTTITMDGHYTITANFETIPATQYNLAIASTTGGSVTEPGGGIHTYDAGTVVNLAAAAEEGYYFVNWTGDVSTVVNISVSTTTITMNDDYSITANFEEIPPDQFGLTISSTTGGSVTAPGEGTFAYEDGTVVNLMASPASGYRFVSWTGNVGTLANVNSASTTITMNGDYLIVANYVAVYTLTISSTDGGSVTTPGEGAFTYDKGTVVNLVANPTSGYRFVNWTGNVGTVANVNAASTTVVMNANYPIIANFETIPEYDLTISSTTGGSVTTPGEGTFTYEEGTVVNLVATPDSCYSFVNWTGNVGTIADVNAASTTIIMKGDYSITANFEEEEPVTFPDPNLEAVIREAIGKPTDDIYKCDLQGLTSLYASEENITDLAGLEHCVNLRGLGLYRNQISDISPLTNLTNLTWLDLQSTHISSIVPLTNLTNLTWLALSSNQIANISPLANLVNLTLLGLDYNLISDISPLNNLINLTRLYLFSNQIANISPLANLVNLTDLRLAYNLISDISPLNNLTRLTELHLDCNQISDISALGSLVNLTRLALFTNQVNNISPLANLTNLTTLELANNQITDISPLVQNKGLGTGDRVGLMYNPLSDDSINVYIPQLQARGVTVHY